LLTVQPLLATITSLLLLTRFWFRRAGPYCELLELLSVALAGVLLPPLLSFALYFCIWHSPRHILRVANELWPGSLSQALARFALAAIPMTFATILAAIASFALIPWDAFTNTRVLQIFFIGLASLTVPHLLVTAAMLRSR
jgi:Brp/Blh family beta-carotene 15,15'-monooxygenase